MASHQRLRRMSKAAFFVALAVMLVFAARLVMFTLHWSDPDNQDQEIEPWMTPGYVAHSWHVPRKVMTDVLGDPVTGNPAEKRKTLEELAEERGVPVQDLIDTLDASIAAYRAEW